MTDHDKIIEAVKKELLRAYITNAGDLELMPSVDIGAKGFTLVHNMVHSSMSKKLGELSPKEREIADDISASLYEIAKLEADRKWRAVLTLLALV